MSDYSKLAPMFAELCQLEQQVSDVAAAADPKNKLRCYPWEPTGVPELPAIWNMIEPGSYEIVDTMRADDAIVVRVSIGVRPSDTTGESMDRLVTLTDHFRDVVDPALNQNQPLGGTAKKAKRTATQSTPQDFNGVAVMCMDMFLRIELSKWIVG